MSRTQNKKMKNWKIAFFVLLVVLIASNSFWFYGIIDQGITITYQQVTIDEQRNSINALGTIIIKNNTKYNKKDILHLLRKTFPETFIVEIHNTILIEGLSFEFDNDKLIKVQ